jgi:uncharacterized protein (TIGR03435 family)
MPKLMEDNPADSASSSSRTSLLTALQDQLGLKVESQKAPVQVLVVDHVEQQGHVEQDHVEQDHVEKPAE